jgi:hypothetical protein
MEKTMKKNMLYLLAFGAVFSLAACFTEPDQTLDEVTWVEFQTTIVSTPATGRTYPFIAAARTSPGVRTTQVNLVGPQRPSDTPINFVVDEASTAVAGTHYRIAGNTFNIPANTSFGQCGIEVLNAPRDSGKTVDVVLRLEQSGDIRPSENYKRIGFRISLN